MSIQNPWFLFSDITDETLSPEQSRKILAYNADLMCVYNHFHVDALGRLHRHPHSQISYILSGRFEFFVDNERKILDPGDSVSILPHQEHGCLCLEEGVVLDIFNPMRKDFLD